jgi:uncharacterized protein (DUF1015 family)
LADGVLRRESSPCLYVYRHQFVDAISGQPRVRRGILGVVELEPFGSGVLPHEQTHARAKADRLSLTRAVVANLSPVFALYDDPASAVGPLVAPAMAEPPRLSITGEDGDRHTVWSIRGAAQFHELAELFRTSRLYMADGHHRYETALNFRNKQRLDHPEAPPDAAFNYVLMLLVDVADPGLTILPTHRLLHDFERFDPALVNRLASRHRVTPRPDRAALLAAMQESTPGHRIGMALAQTPAYFTVDVEQAGAADPVSRLDVSVLHHEILQRELALEPAELESERYLSYSRDVGALLDRVDTGAGQAAFLLRPPAVSDVVEVARAGQVMPQKSTYFFPKPASGIVFNPLAAGIRIGPV